jgi:hypothetical protein
LFALTILLLVGLYFLLRPSTMGSIGEIVPADEDYYTASIVSSAVQLIDLAHHDNLQNNAKDKKWGTGNPAAYRRDAHAKSHGCVKARFHIDEGLAPEWKQGLFAGADYEWASGKRGKQDYDAILRFSSGNARDQKDGTWDARGVAIKVLGLDPSAPKLLNPQDDPEQNTQDFLMINSPQFFIANIPEYAEFSRFLGQGSNIGWFFDGYKLHPSKWHVREFVLAAKTLKPMPRSLLKTQFHSLSAYRYGPLAYVKYSLRPCAGPALLNAWWSTNPNYLRDEMQDELSKREACFDFLVQRQVADKYMPVEDPTVKWKTSDSPFQKVATIHIPKQRFTTADDNTYCENLAMTPWHGLPEHRPVGGLNRVRKPLYLAISRYRHDSNGCSVDATPAAPDDFSSLEASERPATYTCKTDLVRKGAGK